MSTVHDALPLAASTAIGLLIGTERGWHQRKAAEGTRVAGVRTFTLVGLLGGLAGEFVADLGPGVVLAGFLALGALVAVSYLARVRSGGLQSATTDVAALVTYALALGPPLGHGAACGAAAVLVAGLLGWKQRIHGAVAALEERELHAALQLLALAFVALPLLPDAAFGPWSALNLHDLLWKVLLMAGLSFVGYVAMRRMGTRLGLAISALLGGLASSTAVTLDFARRARQPGAPVPLLAAGIVGAGGTMFFRVLVLLAVVRPSLWPSAAWSLGLMTLLCWLEAWRSWRAHAVRGAAVPLDLRNPLQLAMALKFAALLAVVSLAVAAMRAWLGEGGVYAASAVAGVGDVDAVAITLGRMQAEGLAAPVAVLGVVLACITDTLLKAALAWGVGGRAVGLRVALRFLVVLTAGAVAALLAPSP